MIGLVNVTGAVITILIGCLSWFNPRYAMSVLDLTAGPSNMGLTEIRAVSGAVFVGLGAGALWLGTPAAYAMIGFVYIAAAAGRLTGILADGAGGVTPWTFFAFEAVFGLWFLAANLGALR